MVSASALSDDDYDVVSNPGQRSLESSMTDFGHVPAQTVYEPPPSQAAREKFETVSWTAPEIQAYVRRALDPIPPASVDGRTKRIYVDGSFDGFNAGHALQLRQAKLSFPSVYLVVGVYSDKHLQQHGYGASIPHVERCEVLRHCRWVDEVMADVPWELNSGFIDDNRIDYVAIDEGTSVDPGCDKARLKGYDTMKSLKIVIPTRRTAGLAVLLPTRPSTPSMPGSPQPEELPHVDMYGIGY
ncbi:putative cytidylyltransferase-like [Lyophyllum shimeji]|uniref:choline-phosphate cytidylyltransferase n=1 Tax=Lyophyllum shimeji TaxID=47721 RepID=A0A9P3UQL5_LYOSH|nr:putative cytidylyltransferase-like [Lyophyllum shimeji]